MIDESFPGGSAAPTIGTGTESSEPGRGPYWVWTFRDRTVAIKAAVLDPSRSTSRPSTVRVLYERCYALNYI